MENSGRDYRYFSGARLVYLYDQLSDELDFHQIAERITPKFLIAY
jgi:hypothetical protein